LQSAEAQPAPLTPSHGEDAVEERPAVKSPSWLDQRPAVEE
jgi:hypothetical protein